MEGKEKFRSNTTSSAILDWGLDLSRCYRFTVERKNLPCAENTLIRERKRTDGGRPAVTNPKHGEDIANAARAEMNEEAQLVGGTLVNLMVKKSENGKDRTVGDEEGFIETKWCRNRSGC